MEDWREDWREEIEGERGGREDKRDVCVDIRIFLDPETWEETPQINPLNAEVILFMTI